MTVATATAAAAHCPPIGAVPVPQLPVAGQFDDADEAQQNDPDVGRRTTMCVGDGGLGRTLQERGREEGPGPGGAAAAVVTATDGGDVGDDGDDGAPASADNDYDDYDYDYDEDDDDYYAYDEDELRGDVVGNAGTGSGGAKIHMGKNHADLAASKINLDMSHSVSNAVRRLRNTELSNKNSKSNHTGRDDRATSEQCLDPRTRLLLFKMLSTGFLDVVDGCLSTGKEANVYYAKAGRAGAGIAVGAVGGTKAASSPKKLEDKQKQKQKQKLRAKKGTSTKLNAPPADATTTDDDTAATAAEEAKNTQEKEAAAEDTNTEPPIITEYAIKIYKTSILVFKDRDRYVSGEHRFRRGYCKSNPRKMVSTWAEKELRNYRRIHNAGIPCPRPILLKSHVLVMEFLGSNGWPSPRLKDAKLSERRLREAYVQTVLIMRHMFVRCKLVHGDLSEYNLLWHANRVYVIDVSQSVESDHPSALDFLRKDVANVNDYFRKTGNLNTMTTRQLFDFVTSTVVGNTQQEESDELDRIMARVATDAERQAVQSMDCRRAEEQRVAVDEAVFMSQFLPRSLNQVAECDVARIEDGDVEETYAAAVAALTGNEDVVAGAAAVVTKQRRGAAAVDDVGTGGTIGADDGTSVHSVLATSGDTATGHVGASDGRDGDGEPAAAALENDDKKGTGQESCREGGGASDEYGDGEYDDDVDNSCEGNEDDGDSSDDEGERYTKVPLTPVQVAAAKEAKRAANKANKKAVKQAKSEKRLTKIKKKDKRRAIKKTKGNKKK